MVAVHIQGSTVNITSIATSKHISNNYLHILFCLNLFNASASFLLRNTCTNGTYTYGDQWQRLWNKQISECIAFGRLGSKRNEYSIHHFWDKSKFGLKLDELNQTTETIRQFQDLANIVSIPNTRLMFGYLSEIPYQNSHVNIETWIVDEVRSLRNPERVVKIVASPTMSYLMHKQAVFVFFVLDLTNHRQVWQGFENMAFGHVEFKVNVQETIILPTFLLQQTRISMDRHISSPSKRNRTATVTFVNETIIDN